MSQQQTSPRTILLYGPSGVGKSTVIDFARPRMPQVAFGTLDDLVTEYGRTAGLIGQSEGAGELLFRLREDGFLELGRRAADRFRACYPESEAIVFDVGAGFLESNLVEPWIAQSDSIVLMADASTALARLKSDREDHRSLDEYAKGEFRDNRKKLYEMACYQIDTNELSEKQVVDKLVETLTELLARDS